MGTYYLTNTGDNWGWDAGSSGTYYAATTAATWPVKARVVLEDVPVEPPKPKSEVDRLLADVEMVCALAR